MEIPTQARDDGHISDVLSVDFAKAFERVLHKSILHKVRDFDVYYELL